MLNCPVCHLRNPDDSGFCRACGSALALRCPRCDHNPPEAAFCGACGRRLRKETERDKDLLAGQRRRVAVLFADLSGSTALGERFDAEVVFEVMNTCFAGLAEIIDRYEGTVLKYIGDAMMVLFGAPVAHGDDPQRAVMAGLEMQAWLSKYSEKLEAERGVPFRMRIGINHGPVIAGGVGALGRIEYDVLGDAVNVAQRLESAAAPGTVLVSESVQRLARGRVDFEAMGLVRVKGRGGSVGVFRATRIKNESELGAGERKQFVPVGRDKELAMLRQTVDELAAGRGQFLGLNGEPGIGKSTLVEQTVQRAREEGIDVYWISGAEKEGYAPLGTFRQWLGEAFDTIGADDVEERLRALLPQDSAAYEYLQELIQLMVPGIEPAQKGLDPETRRRLQIQAVCAAVASRAEKAPVLLALDDLQWMDPLTQEVAQTLADRILAGELKRCTLLLSYRAGSPPSWLTQEGSEVYREHIKFLPSLDESSCLDLMRQWINPEELPAEILDGIISRAGGHPHYLVELLMHLLETEALRLEEGHWRWSPKADGAELPDTLYGTVAARLDRLRQSQLSAVQHGATVGQQFPVWLVRELEPKLDWDENLHALEGMQFLTELVPPPEWEMRFRQAVVRDVAYESLLRVRRKELHCRIAGLIQERVPIRECAALLAGHYEYAESWNEAARCHHEAGRFAAEVFSNQDALKHQSACLVALNKAGVDPQSEPVFNARRALAGVAARMGEYERAADEYEKCLEWTGVTCEAKADIYGQLARCHHETGEVQEAADLWRRALRTLGNREEPESERIRAALLGEWGFAAYRSGRFSRASRLATWSYAAAVRANALLERGDASNLRGLVHQAQGGMDEAIEAYRETQRVAIETGDIAALATVQNNLGTLLFAQGQLEEAQHEYEAALSTWDRIGDRGQCATVLTNMGNLALARGQYDDAVLEFDLAQKLFNAVKQPFGAAAAAAVLGEVRLEQGQPEEAREILLQALAQAESVDSPDLAAYAGLGLAEASLRLGNLTEAEQFLEGACARILEFDLVGLQGQEWRLRAKCQLAGGDSSGCVVLLRKSLDHFEEFGMQQEAGRTLVLLASALGGDEARLLLDRACEIFREVGAVEDLRRLESLEIVTCQK